MSEAPENDGEDGTNEAGDGGGSWVNALPGLGSRLLILREVERLEDLLFLLFGRLAELTDFLNQLLVGPFIVVIHRIRLTDVCTWVVLQSDELMAEGFLISEEAAIKIQDGDWHIGVAEASFDFGKKLFALLLGGVQNLNGIDGHGQLLKRERVLYLGAKVAFLQADY